MKKTVKTRIVLAALFVAALALGCAPAAKRDIVKVWPDPPEVPRVKYTNTYTGPIDFVKTTFVQDVVLGETQVETFRKPMSIYVDPSDRIFVTDTGRAKVFVLDRAGTKHDILKMRGGFLKPVGVTGDAAGNIYVTDTSLARLMVFDKNLQHVKDITAAGVTLKYPAGLAADNKNNLLYVADSQGHIVHVYDLKTHKHLRTVGKGRGTNPEYFNFPAHLTVDDRGNLYVTDSMNARIQIFDKKGNFLKTFGQFGDALGMFARPKGVAVDSEGHIYVVDAAFNNVQIFNEDGELLLFFGGYGKAPWNMILPAGMFIDKDDYIYVSDSWNERLVIYEYLGEKHAQRQKTGSVPLK